MKGSAVLALALAGVLYLPALGARDLWNPNEPLYAAVVAEMAARDDWIVPFANGEPFGEKPILYFWLALAAAKALGGVGEGALRLPAALSGLALVAGTALLVAPYAGRRRATLAATIVATFFVVFWSARQIQMDLTLAACSLAALVAASRVLDRGASPVAGWSAAGAAAGLGMLAKGPVGAIVPLAVVAGYVVASHRWVELCRPAVALAPAIAAAVAAPWLVALGAHGGAALWSELLVRQNVSRFLEPWDHAQGPWYYLAYLWIDLLPWSLFLPLAVGLAATDDRERQLHRLAWIWIAVIVLFFSLSASKRSPYILPVAPAVAVLVAAVGQRWIEGRLDPLRRRAAAALLALVAAGWIVGSVLVVREARELAPRLPELGGALRVSAGIWLASGCATLAALFAARRHPLAAPAVVLAAVAACYLHAAVVVLPALDPLKSHRPMADAIRRHVPAERPLVGFHAWRWRADFSFYAGRPIPVIQEVEQLAEYWSRPEPVFLLVERGRIDEARRVIGPREPLAYHEAGHNAAFLFSNFPAAQRE